jgi:hypothetical protein
MHKRPILYQAIGAIVFVAGGVMMVRGFSQWYDKLQRHLERLALPPQSAPRLKTKWSTYLLAALAVLAVRRVVGWIVEALAGGGLWALVNALRDLLRELKTSKPGVPRNPG